MFFGRPLGGRSPRTYQHLVRAPRNTLKHTRPLHTLASTEYRCLPPCAPQPHLSSHRVHHRKPPACCPGGIQSPVSVAVRLLPVALPPIPQYTHTAPSRLPTGAPIWCPYRRGLCDASPPPASHAGPDSLQVYPFDPSLGGANATPLFHQHTHTNPRFYQQDTICRRSPRQVAAPGGATPRLLSTSSPTSIQASTNKRPYAAARLGRAMQRPRSISISRNPHSSTLSVLMLSFSVTHPHAPTPALRQPPHRSPSRVLPATNVKLTQSCLPPAVSCPPPFGPDRWRSRYPHSFRCLFPPVPSPHISIGRFKATLLLRPFLVDPCELIRTET